MSFRGKGLDPEPGEELGDAVGELASELPTDEAARLRRVEVAGEREVHRSREPSLDLDRFKELVLEGRTRVGPGELVNGFMAMTPAAPTPAGSKTAPLLTASRGTTPLEEPPIETTWFGSLFDTPPALAETPAAFLLACAARNPAKYMARS